LKCIVQSVTQATHGYGIAVNLQNITKILRGTSRKSHFKCLLYSHISTSIEEAARELAQSLH